MNNDELLTKLIYYTKIRLNIGITDLSDTVKNELAFYNRLESDPLYRKFYHSLHDDLIAKNNYKFQEDQLFHIISFSMLQRFKCQEIPEDIVKSLNLQTN